MDWLTFSSAFMLGLLSSVHCVGMCGGIMGALTMAIPKEAQGRRVGLLLAYNLGRIGTYCLIGLLVGFMASWFDHWGANVLLRWLAGLMLIAMGLYLANWWRGLTYVEALGRYLWAYLQPLSKALLPVKTLPRALLLGAVWGWLPCGLVYTALVYAMTQAHALTSAGVMLAFGLGTLPMVLATGFAAQLLTRILQDRALRSLMALCIIAFGVWTIWIVGFGMDMSSGHMHMGTMDHSSMSPAAMTPDAMNHSDMNHSSMNHSMEMNSSDMSEADMTPDNTAQTMNTMDKGAMDKGAMAP